MKQEAESKKHERAEVLIVIGSRSDSAVMGETKKMLDEFGISARLEIASAHRNPKKVEALIRETEKSGIKVIIAGAGLAAHLAGAIAARTILPVIGVPLESSSLKGLDALLSTVQMPMGVPVAAVAIGKTGAKNAALLAAQILALTDKKIAARIKAWRKKNS